MSAWIPRRHTVKGNYIAVDTITNGDNPAARCTVAPTPSRGGQ